MPWRIGRALRRRTGLGVAGAHRSIYRCDRRRGRPTLRADEPDRSPPQSRSSSVATTSSTSRIAGSPRPPRAAASCCCSPARRASARAGCCRRSCARRGRPGFQVGAGPTSRRRTARCRWRSILDLGPHDARRRPGSATLGDDVFARARRRGGDSLGHAAAARPRHRRADHRRDRRPDPARLRGPPVGGRAQPRGHRRARPAGPRPADARSSAATASTSCRSGSIHREWRARLLSQRLAEEARLAPLTYEQTALVTTLILDTGLPAPREVVDAVYAADRRHPAAHRGAARRARRGRRAATGGRSATRTSRRRSRTRSSRGSPACRPRPQAVARAGAVIGRCFIPEVARRASWTGRSPTSTGRSTSSSRTRSCTRFGIGRRGLLRLPPPAAPRRAVRQRPGRPSCAGCTPGPASSAPRSSAHPRSTRRSTSSGRACAPRPIARRSRAPARPARCRAGARPSSCTGGPSPTPPTTCSRPSSPRCMRR